MFDVLQSQMSKLVIYSKIIFLDWPHKTPIRKTHGRYIDHDLVDRYNLLEKFFPSQAIMPILERFLKFFRPD